MFETEIRDSLRRLYPDSRIGVLLIGNIANRDEEGVLEEIKREAESDLVKRYSGLDRSSLLENEVLNSYKNYYKRFKKTYHVLLQLESIVNKKRHFPVVNPLVDSCFISEIKSLILTAGHDADLVKYPVTVDIAMGGEEFVQISGNHKLLKKDDIIMKDSENIICSVLDGQDKDTSITSSTKKAMFVVYSPGGVDRRRVEEHLESIRQYVLLFSPEAEAEVLKVN